VRLGAYRRVLAVVAHPDDESFGLGAVLHALGQAGTETSVLCFTHGEASTLGGAGGDLGRTRARELEQASAVLGITRTELLDYPDGGLADIELEALAGHVRRVAEDVGAGALLVFDEGGVTGHGDHRRATEAALAAAGAAGLDVLAWALPQDVAAALNAEFCTAFVGRPHVELGVQLTVDRTCQHRAIAQHHSQSVDNPVLWRRLELLGDSEWLRRLRTDVR